MVSCSKGDVPEPPEISAVWAVANVAGAGEFAENAWEAGGYFTFDEARQACPAGWRLPTPAEFENLAEASRAHWTTEGGVKGSSFGSETAVFLPAAGFRDAEGVLDTQDSNGDPIGIYWTAEQNIVACFARNYYLFCGELGALEEYRRMVAFSVRCVKEG